MEFMTAAQAAEYLCVSKPQVYKLAEARRIAYYQDGPGARMRFRREDLDKYLEGTRVETVNLRTLKTYRKRRA